MYEITLFLKENYKLNKEITKELLNEAKVINLN